MKNLILGISFIVALSGCKKNCDCNEKKDVSKNKEAVTDKKTDKVTYKFTNADSIATGCNDPIYFSKDILSDTYLTNNPSYVCSSEADNDGDISVDLSEVINTKESSDWLGKVYNKINFPKSYDAIEVWRKVPPRDIAKIPGDIAYKSMSLDNIKQRIEDLKGNYGDHYLYYLIFTVDSTSANFTLGQFNSAENCFSIPLFRSIIANNRITGNPIFEFGKLPDTNHIIFRVKKNKKYLYYNFTNNPPTYFRMSIL